MTTSNNNINLTELWEKGELEVDKYYYVKYADGSVEIQLYVGGFLMRTDNRVVEVLSPVPTFDEMKLVALKIDCICETIAELAVEKEQLIKLLTECKDVMSMAGYVFAKIEDVEKARELLTKIDEVLK